MQETVKKHWGGHLVIRSNASLNATRNSRSKFCFFSYDTFDRKSIQNSRCLDSKTLLPPA